MLKLNPLKSEKVWGYENWIASVHSVMSHEELISQCGKDYPLLIKVIQADDTLSVQVHPDDEAAAKIEGEGNRGKTECWYVLDAVPDAKIVFGLKKNDKPYSKEELSEAIKNKALENYLHFANVKKGDFIFIPSGTVHAIGGGIRLLEVQQSCDLTYRLYDWGRPREVHIEKGLSVIKEDNLKPIVQFDKSFECKYFSLEEINISGGYSVLCSKGNNAASDWQMIFILDGNGSIKNDSGLKFDFEKENIFALKPGEKFTIEGKTRILKIKCK